MTTCDPNEADSTELAEAVATLVGAVGLERAIAHIRKGPRGHPISPAKRAAVLAKCESRCAYCDRKITARTRWHVDHVIPQSKGGGHGLDNLVAACAPCNSSKRDNHGYRCIHCEGYAWYALHDTAHDAICERRQVDRATREWAEWGLDLDLDEASGL